MLGSADKSPVNGASVAPAFQAALPDYVGLCGCLFLCFLALGAYLPVLPLLSKDTLSAGDFTIGLIVTVTAAAAFVTRPIAGNLAERLNYRRVMIGGALLIATGSAFMFAPLSVPALVAIRLVHGIGEGAVFTAGAIWIIRLAPENRHGRIIGIYGLSMWSGTTLGALLGAVLQNSVSFSAVWVLAVILPILGALITARVFAPGHGHREQQLFVFPRSVIAPGTSLALAAAGYSGLAAFVVLHLESRGIAGGVAALNAFGATYVVVRLVFGDLPDRVGPKKVAILSACGEAVGLLIVALAPGFWIAVAGGLIMGAGFSLLYPSLVLIALRNTEPERQGAALGAVTSFWDIGLGLSGPLLGLVAHGFGYAMVFGTAMIFAIAAAVISNIDIKRRGAADGLDNGSGT